MNENQGIQTKAKPEGVPAISSKVQDNISWPEIRENDSGLELGIRGGFEPLGLELYVGGSNVSTEQIRIQAVDVSTETKRRNEYHKQSE